MCVRVRVRNSVEKFCSSTTTKSGFILYVNKINIHEVLCCEHFDKVLFVVFFSYHVFPFGIRTPEI